MSIPVVHESATEELDLPGRHLRWIVDGKNINSQYSSMCVIRVGPRETVRPAHSHPNGEEVIYILSGFGRVMVEGEVSPVQTGSTVLFEQGKIHMLRNDSDQEMKVVCFFAPPSDLGTYKFFPEIDFPE